MNCAICLKSLDKNDAVTACECRKDLIYHKECLIKWVDSKKDKKCEFCNNPYKTCINPNKMMLSLMNVCELSTSSICTITIIAFITEYFIKWIVLLIILFGAPVGKLKEIESFIIPIVVLMCSPCLMIVVVLIITMIILTLIIIAKIIEAIIIIIIAIIKTVILSPMTDVEIKKAPVNNV